METFHPELRTALQMPLFSFEPLPLKESLYVPGTFIIQPWSNACIYLRKLSYYNMLPLTWCVISAGVHINQYNSDTELDALHSKPSKI